VGVIRITDDDPTPSVRISDATVLEPEPGGVTNAVFNVTLSAPSGLPVSFNFITSNGTAIAEKDYLPQVGEVVMDAGVTNAQILIPVFGDQAAEPPEFFFLNVYAPLNAFTVGGAPRCTILDNGYVQLDHFSINGWPSPQYAGVPFVASVTAKDGRNNGFTDFSGQVSIRAVLPQPEVVIGASTSLWAQPFGTHYHDSRTQVIYLRDELGGPDNLSGLSLFVATPPPQTLSNWTIRLKHTALAQYLKPAWEGSGWTSVYQNHETIFATGWVTFLFSAPFAYDGTNNLMVDLSFNNSSFTSDEAQVRYHSASSDRTAWFQTDSAFGDPLRWSGTSAPPPSPTNAVPNLRFLREDPVATTPAASGDFVNGVWTGLVTLNQSGSNVVLRVSDGANHSGASDPFVVESGLASNGDGLPDSWKARYFAPGAIGSGPNDDPDDDGFTNLEEFQAGTDPLNAGSAIRISEIGSSNGEVRLKFETVLGKAYRLETAENPAGPWSTLAASIIGTGGTVRFADSAIQSQPKRFYRVRLLP
ncbi:MAG TPA: Calx-beta domain-containing protein, partial [Verrucomicrobiae bacterium]|nr:Calx-beta domain-containing protein [Verrucomicrobiae bacterium]